MLTPDINFFYEQPSFLFVHNHIVFRHRLIDITCDDFCCLNNQCYSVTARCRCSSVFNWFLQGKIGGYGGWTPHRKTDNPRCKRTKKLDESVFAILGLIICYYFSVFCTIIIIQSYLNIHCVPKREPLNSFTSYFTRRFYMYALQKCSPHLQCVATLTHSLTAALDQLRVVASSTSNDPGPRSRQHQQIGQRLLLHLLQPISPWTTRRALPVSSGRSAGVGFY